VEEEKHSSVKKAVAAINRKYGAGKITTGLPPVERVPTGIASLDLLTRQFVSGKLVSYGIPLGQHTMFWGGEDVGKTCLAFKVARAFQERGMTVLLTDAEHRYDPIWAIQNGVDQETLSILKPDSMEEYLDITIATAADFSLRIVDSVVSVASIGEREDKSGKQRGMSDDTIALNARQLSKFFRVANPSLSKGKVASLWLNQIRTHGIGGFRTYDDFPGGKAIRHYLSTSIKLSRRKTTEKIVQGHDFTPSHDVVLRVTKGMNEMKETTSTFYVECGFDPLADLVRQSIVYGIVTREGKSGRYNMDGQDKPLFLQDIFHIMDEDKQKNYERLMETQNPASHAEESDNNE
jgi:RecA/RadA recombinase